MEQIDCNLHIENMHFMFGLIFSEMYTNLAFNLRLLRQKFCKIWISRMSERWNNNSELDHHRDMYNLLSFLDVILEIFRNFHDFISANAVMTETVITQWNHVEPKSRQFFGMIFSLVSWSRETDFCAKFKTNKTKFDIGDIEVC